MKNIIGTLRTTVLVTAAALLTTAAGANADDAAVCFDNIDIKHWSKAAPVSNLVKADTSFDAAQVWQQSQMTEAFMRKIDKWSCVEKTKMTLKAGCSKTEKCLKTMAGLLGDCLTYSKGDTGEFCEVFPKWRRQSCFKEDFDGRACVFFEISEDTFCKGRESKSLQ